MDRANGTLVGLGPIYRSIPLAYTADRIGAVDFGRLLLAKGIELGLIEENTTTDSEGMVSYGTPASHLLWPDGDESAHAKPRGRSRTDLVPHTTSGVSRWFHGGSILSASAATSAHLKPPRSSENA